MFSFLRDIFHEAIRAYSERTVRADHPAANPTKTPVSQTDCYQFRPTLVTLEDDLDWDALEERDAERQVMHDECMSEAHLDEKINAKQTTILLGFYLVAAAILAVLVRAGIVFVLAHRGDITDWSPQVKQSVACFCKEVVNTMRGNKAEVTELKRRLDELEVRVRVMEEGSDEDLGFGREN